MSASTGSGEHAAESNAGYEQGYRDGLTAAARLMFSPHATEILRPLLPDARCYDPRCTIAEHDHSTSVIPPGSYPS